MSTCSCGGSNGKKILLFACSGGSNVAEASDKAARQLMADGAGAMYCLAGLGAGIASMIQTARDADLNVVIDGCPMDCARKIFEKSDVQNAVFVRVTDLGIAKAPKGTRATDDDVWKVVSRVKQDLATA